MAWFGIKINILRNKIHFKATQHLEGREKMRFLSPPLFVIFKLDTVNALQFFKVLKLWK